MQELFANPPSSSWLPSGPLTGRRCNPSMPLCCRKGCGGVPWLCGPTGIRSGGLVPQRLLDLSPMTTGALGSAISLMLVLMLVLMLLHAPMVGTVWSGQSPMHHTPSWHQESESHSFPDYLQMDRPGILPACPARGGRESESSCKRLSQ